MALTETPTELAGPDVYVDDPCERTIRSIQSIQSIKSLREIPLVDNSLDLDYDSMISERHQGFAAPMFSTPLHFKSGNNSDASTSGNASLQSARESLGSIYRSAGLLQDDDAAQSSHAQVHRGSDSNADTTQLPDILPENHTTSSHESLQRASSRRTSDEKRLMDEISRSAGALAAMNDYLSTWASTAHFVIVASAALRRDAAAFASSLVSLLSPSNFLDPNGFASQYYQLREAYSSLLEITDFNVAATGQQGWKRASSKSSSGLGRRNSTGDFDTNWDDRQLVDSFMTLLRTSPGFLASAMSQMSETEALAFFADGDGSPINVLFHGVLGSARKNRPQIFAEVVLNLVTDSPHRTLVVQTLLRTFIDLSIASLSSRATTMLDRCLRKALSGSFATNILSVFKHCIPEEFAEFTSSVLGAKGMEEANAVEFETLVTQQLLSFSRQLIENPHQFGLLSDVFLGDKQGAILADVALGVAQHISVIVGEFRSTKVQRNHLWIPEELVVVKGSDIILLYNSLLPARDTGSPASHASNEEDEWCLDNIRSDLVPVMRELTHSTNKSDGWQVFKVGDDGLVTDLGSDLGLTSRDPSGGDWPDIGSYADEVICNAIAYHDGETFASRLAAARTEAELNGDHLSLLELEQAQTSNLTEEHANAMNRRVAALKWRCRALRRTLDDAARAQRRERERLSRLLLILDSSRVHVWYEAEVRLGSPYARSREVLRALYAPQAEEKDGYDSLLRNPFASEATASNSIRSRRRSFLSSHSHVDNPFYNRQVLPYGKLSDKEVDNVISFMRRNRVRNTIPAEEVLHRALVEVATLSRKLIDRDHIASYAIFKRDRQYQTQTQQMVGGSQRAAKRQSQNRRSSLGLFDFFDSSSHSPPLPVTLHTTTSTQFLGLAKSTDSLRQALPATLLGDEITHVGSIGPPRGPSISLVYALVLSDLGLDFMSVGAESDVYMQQTGRMLLEGDGQVYQPLLDDVSMTVNPETKLSLFEELVKFTRARLQSAQASRVSRSDVIHELGKVFGREPGTLYRDLQTVATLVNPSVLDRNDAFEDVCEAAKNVADTVVVRSMDYAARFLRYYLEETSTAVRMANIGIADSVAIWAFCAKYGKQEAQKRLSELYRTFSHLKLELRPFSRPGRLFEGVDPADVREAVAHHWASQATHL